MKFIYSELQQLSDAIKANAKAQITALDKFGKDIKALSTSTKTAGEAGPNMQAYFSTVYLPIITAMKALINNHSKNCILYIKNYETNKMGGETKIDTTELNAIKKEVKNSWTNWNSVNEKTVSFLNNARGKGVNIGNPDIGDIRGRKQEEINYINHINESIKAIEAAVKKADGKYSGSFAATATLIANIKTLLGQRGNNSVRIGSFDAKSFWGSPEGKEVRFSTLALWLEAYIYQDEYNQIDLELGDISVYEDFDGLIYMDAFKAWDQDDIDDFRQYQFVSTSDFPEELRQYFDNGYGNIRNADGANGNCTWFALGRYCMIQGICLTGGKDFPMDNASGWFSQAPNYGLKTGYIPTPGSIVCFGGPSNDGHVAVVESVTTDENGNTIMTISQSGWSDSTGKFAYIDKMTIYKDGSYSGSFGNSEEKVGIWGNYKGCIYPKNEFTDSYNKSVNSNSIFGDKLTDEDKTHVRSLGGVYAIKTSKIVDSSKITVSEEKLEDVKVVPTKNTNNEIKSQAESKSKALSQKSTNTQPKSSSSATKSNIKTTVKTSVESQTVIDNKKNIVDKNITEAAKRADPRYRIEDKNGLTKEEREWAAAQKSKNNGSTSANISKQNRIEDEHGLTKEEREWAAAQQSKNSTVAQTEVSTPPKTETTTPEVYTVKKGDTLWDIGQKYDVDYRDIAADNDIDNPSLIHPGEKFTIRK